MADRGGDIRKGMNDGSDKFPRLDWHHASLKKNKSWNSKPEYFRLSCLFSIYIIIIRRQQVFLSVVT